MSNVAELFGHSSGEPGQNWETIVGHYWISGNPSISLAVKSPRAIRLGVASNRFRSADSHIDAISESSGVNPLVCDSSSMPSRGLNRVQNMPRSSFGPFHSPTRSIIVRNHQPSCSGVSTIRMTSWAISA